MDDMKQNHKLTIIVGPGSGIGLSIARKFASNGFGVVLVARKKDRLHQCVSELKNLGINAFGVPADSTDPSSVKNAFEQIRTKYGVPEVLIYNAVIRRKKAPSCLTEEELMNDFKVNVIGAKTCITEVLPDFVKQKKGTFLVTGGGFALHPSIDFSSMSLGKAALRNFIFSLGEELQTKNIYVGTVTIMGKIEKNTKYDPERIAQAYWNMYSDQNKRELIFK
ncbi:SDR family NAD(P)-dependent oxidoreductase [Sporolactobacillus shoreicorticis]|uniref:SDR family NAD(P)-dependent oxidoreductase n=1 Tax=Sporolactobacillus shoreicorticis TaxID=1923877 RepID=A0ABW5S428_9BACL|nr:SDR family NAD(P)-dependent oxidoreductase [Sporolactobacillus shoreicorticis]MCO7124571.1 SDR family NAD(P)-dependent oxidoreductase [Sporolactobacillus shoreicorticis]